MTNLEKIKEAVTNLKEASPRQIRDFIKSQHGSIRDNSINTDIVQATVNNNSRVFYNPNKSARQANNPKYDILYRTDRKTLVIFDPTQHGNWEIRATDDGKVKVCQVSDGAADHVVDSQRQLSLIGTWKEVVDEHEAVEEAIKQRGGWASWWSFPIEEEAQRLLKTPFYIYLNSGSGMTFPPKTEPLQS